MEQFFTKQMRHWLFIIAFICGLPMASTAETITVTEDVTLEGTKDEIVFTAGKNAPIKAIFKAVTANKITIEAGCNVEFSFEGTNKFDQVINNGTAKWLYTQTGKITCNQIMNEGLFDDQTGMITSVQGASGFTINSVRGLVDGDEYTTSMFVQSKWTVLENCWTEADGNLEMWNGTTWVESGLPTKAPKVSRSNIELAFEGSSSHSVNQSGIYRVKFVGENIDDEKKQSILYSRPLEMKKITTSTNLKDNIFDALLIAPQQTEEPITLNFENVFAHYAEGPHAAACVARQANVILNLKGHYSSLKNLTNYGKLLLTREGTDTRLNETEIYNKGVFTDLTGTVSKVYGPAGIWIEFIKFLDNTAPDGTLIKGVNCKWKSTSFKTNVVLEIYKDGKWENSDKDADTRSLRSGEGEGEDDEWMTATKEVTIQTATKGTYRLKFQAMEEACVTTIYSEPFTFVDDLGIISDENTTLGEEESQTVLPALEINAGGESGTPIEATLTNVSIQQSEVDAPSVTVKEKANVNLTLKGSNDLGDITILKGAQIILKPAQGEMMADLQTRTIHNGGSFEDQTATISKVMDLEGKTMIEFTDTMVVQIGDIMSISLRSVSNTVSGGYILYEGDSPEKWDAEGKKWETYGKSTKAMRSSTEQNKTGESVSTLSTQEAGIYRLKVSSEALDDKTKNATLYFVFEIKNITPQEVTESTDLGSSDKQTRYEMLVLNAPGSEIKVGLTNIAVDSYTNMTSTVVTEKTKAVITLNGENDLGNFDIMDKASVTLKKGNSFKELKAVVINSGKFVDETGTINTVRDSRGFTMLNIKAFGNPLFYNAYMIVAEFNFFQGNYEVSSETGIAAERWDGSKWVVFKEQLYEPKRKSNLRSEEPVGEIALNLTGLAPGQYRFKVHAEEWIDGIDEGSDENPHTATLYKYFTVEKEDPVGNAEIDDAATKVWGKDGKLYISLPVGEKVWIYNYNGSLIRSLGEVSGDRVIDLPRGSYIVLIGKQTYKLAL